VQPSVSKDKEKYGTLLVRDQLDERLDGVQKRYETTDDSFVRPDNKLFFPFIKGGALPESLMSETSNNEPSIKNEPLIKNEPSIKNESLLFPVVIIRMKITSHQENPSSRESGELKTGNIPHTIWVEDQTNENGENGENGGVVKKIPTNKDAVVPKNEMYIPIKGGNTRRHRMVNTRRHRMVTLHNKKPVNHPKTRRKKRKTKKRGGKMTLINTTFLPNGIVLSKHKDILVKVIDNDLKITIPNDYSK